MREGRARDEDEQERDETRDEDVGSGHGEGLERRGADRVKSRTRRAHIPHARLASRGAQGWVAAGTR